MIKSFEFITESLYKEIKALEEVCLSHDQTSLKLELDYKFETGKISKPTQTLNEFLYYDQGVLIGYIGICCFNNREIEVNGMVHPDYRGLGVFTALFEVVKKEWHKRDSMLLLLSDAQSTSGLAFIKKIQGQFENAEYEMYLEKNIEPLQMDLVFRKANNLDVDELNKQNSIYFKKDAEAYTSLVLPEEEEKKGVIIYLVEKDHQVIGKVNLAIEGDIGGIYGLGVLPEHRRKGYGRQILLMSIKILQERCEKVMLQVVVENSNALNLYLDCGFVVHSTMNYYSL